MSRTKVTLREMFGSEMAQHDPHFNDYVVDRSDLLTDISSDKNDLLIINAARGSGKSGLLIIFEEILKKNTDNIIIKRYYAEITLPDGKITVNGSIGFWKNFMLGSIVSEVGKDTSFAFWDDEISAVEFSESQGDREHNLLTSILNRLKFKGNIIEKCDFDPNLNIGQLSRIVSKSSKTYWILLDEMDDIYDNGDNINLLIGLIQASSFIASKFSNVRIRLTIRPHILTYLRLNNPVIQKIKECELKITWNISQLREIIYKRLDFYERSQGDINQTLLELTPQTEDDNNKYKTELISKYFSDFDMSFNDDSESNYRAFGTLCFYRPRWMIEFCKEVMKLVAEGEKATNYHYKRAFSSFGQNRIQFTIGEFSIIYPFIMNALSAVAAIRKTIIGNSKKLRSEIINRILKQGYIEYDQKMEFIKSLEIAQALYKVEFIRAKEIIPGPGNNHRFHYYSERPDLLQSWTNEPHICWEIHPTFARALNIKDSDIYEVAGEVKVFGKKNKSNKKTRKVKKK